MKINIKNILLVATVAIITYGLLKVYDNFDTIISSVKLGFIEGFNRHE